jgi:hypothetical protein
MDIPPCFQDCHFCHDLDVLVVLLCILANFGVYLVENGTSNGYALLALTFC